MRGGCEERCTEHPSKGPKRRHVLTLDSCLIRRRWQGEMGSGQCFMFLEFTLKVYVEDGFAATSSTIHFNFYCRWVGGRFGDTGNRRKHFGKLKSGKAQESQSRKNSIKTLKLILFASDPICLHHQDRIANHRSAGLSLGKTQCFDLVRIDLHQIGLFKMFSD